MEEGGVYGNVTIQRRKTSNATCFFTLDMILLVWILTLLWGDDLFAQKQQRNKEENPDRMR